MQDINLLGQKQQLDIIALMFYFPLCIHQLSSFHVLAISAERQSLIWIRGVKAFSVKSEAVDGRMGGDTGQVQGCNNALSSLQAVVMPEIDLGGGSQ